jgi:invasion protein IalB
MSMIFSAFSTHWRAAVAGFAALGLASALASAEAATKKAEKSDAAKPNLVASFGDWNVFVSQTAKGRICYVLAQPKTREPDGLKRDPGYAFISDRPAEGVRNEVSFIMGFDVAGGTDMEANADPKSDTKPRAKAGTKRAKAEAKAKAVAAPLATVGEESFDLLPKGADLWVKNAARETALIAEMKKGATLEIKAASLKGNASTDGYSLSGFSQAMERLQKECPSRTQANIQQ